MNTQENQLGFFAKWNIYQKERFPLLKHAILILAFSSSAVSFSSLTSGRMHPNIYSYVVAFITCFLFFLQLRIADEFKDYEEDCLYRNYRPVPQGIIKLKELGTLFIIASAIQLLVASLFNIKLGAILLVVWVYLTLMSREFGIKKWLKAHPITYMWSHMVIMPMVDFYATASDWIQFGSPSNSLYWFVLLSFFNGINLEIGRKIRSPEDEEKGVDTYSFLWGIKKSTLAWFSMMGLTGICGIFASLHLPKPFTAIISAYVIIYALVSLFCILKFYKNHTKGKGKVFEMLSGLFTLGIYLLLGLIPLFYHYFIN
jgi:4-hydroxybenzoate polyprenyltransferase